MGHLPGTHNGAHGRPDDCMPDMSVACLSVVMPDRLRKRYAAAPELCWTDRSRWSVPCKDNRKIYEKTNCHQQFSAHNSWSFCAAPIFYGFSRPAAAFSRVFRQRAECFRFFHGTDSPSGSLRDAYGATLITEHTVWDTDTACTQKGCRSGQRMDSCGSQSC